MTATPQPVVRVVLDDVLPDRLPAPGGPRVAVLVALNFPQLTEPVAELVRRFTRTALQTLIDIGADPMLVDLSAPPLPPIDQVLACDGVLLLGGGDMDAALYGHEGPVNHGYGVDRDIDDYSIRAVLATMAADLPLLGVCRGSQVVNVALGGTLIPDIEDFALHRGDGGDAVFLEEMITVAPDSRLAGMVGGDRISVRTGHHQAVKDVAPALRAVGWADDGIVEAIEHPDRWVVGVQWHPEDSHGSDEDRHRLFGAFVAEINSRRG